MLRFKSNKKIYYILNALVSSRSVKYILNVRKTVYKCNLQLEYQILKNDLSIHSNHIVFQKANFSHTRVTRQKYSTNSNYLI